MKIKNENIGTNIKMLRKEHHITQEELAKELKISQEKICRIEASKSSLSVEEAQKVASFFKISIDELFSLKISNKKEPEKVIEIKHDDIIKQVWAGIPEITIPKRLLSEYGFPFINMSIILKELPDGYTIYIQNDLPIKLTMVLLKEGLKGKEELYRTTISEQFLRKLIPSDIIKEFTHLKLMV